MAQDFPREMRILSHMRTAQSRGPRLRCPAWPTASAIQSIQPSKTWPANWTNWIQLGHSIFNLGPMLQGRFGVCITYSNLPTGCWMGTMIPEDPTASLPGTAPSTQEHQRSSPVQLPAIERPSTAVKRRMAGWTDPQLNLELPLQVPELEVQLLLVTPSGRHSLK